MNVCVIGGGNIGAALAARIGLKQPVTLCCTKAAQWQQEVVLVDDFYERPPVTSHITSATTEYRSCIPQADIILITHPSFLAEKTLNSIAPYVKPGARIGIVPGYGGSEFYARPLLEKGVVFFGFDRVPCIARIEDYGMRINASYKAASRIASIPPQAAPKICKELGEVLAMELLPLRNYLSVTLTPSNPILHTSRLYSLFHANGREHFYAEAPAFYGDWSLEASQLLLGCDEELQQLCAAINDPAMRDVIPLRTHYESDTPEKLTAKLRSIPTLTKTASPMLQRPGGYVVNFDSRYFTEDFPYGLCIIKGFCLIYQVKTPTVDKLLNWYQAVAGKEYFINDKIGRDIGQTSAPQAFGIIKEEDVREFYHL